MKSPKQNMVYFGTVTGLKPVILESANQLPNLVAPALKDGIADAILEVKSSRELALLLERISLQDINLSDSKGVVYSSMRLSTMIMGLTVACMAITNEKVRRNFIDLACHAVPQVYSLDIKVRELLIKL